jgi:micrococcal nuclease
LIRFRLYGFLFFLVVVMTTCTEKTVEAPQLYITETGKKYHHDGCRYLKRSRIPISLSAAVEMGYTPCGHCDPPSAGQTTTPPAEAAELYRVNVSDLKKPEEADVARMTRAVVVRHVDGDTVYVSVPRPPEGIKGYESVRFIGVDTPETVHPQKAVEFFGKEASDFTKSHLLNQPVYLAFDWELRDRYDRLLAYIYLADGSCFNALLVKEGYAHAYTRFPFQFLEQFRALERDARGQRRGLWGAEGE